jgi:hypothetical protein
MLKRIALTVVFVATAAFAGVGVAKAHPGSAKNHNVSGTVTPQGMCFGKC